MSLLTEQNNSKVDRLIRSAASQQFGRGKARRYFEHGQWWVIVPDHNENQDLIYSVVDASPGIGRTGLDFEQVS